MPEFKVIDEMSDNNSLVLEILCSGTEAGSAKSLFGSGLYRLDKRETGCFCYSFPRIRQIWNNR